MKPKTTTKNDKKSTTSQHNRIRDEVMERLEEAGKKVQEEFKACVPPTLSRAVSENACVERHLTRLGTFKGEGGEEGRKLREEAVKNVAVCKKLNHNEKKLLEKFVATKKVINLLEVKAKEFEEKQEEVRGFRGMIEDLQEEIKESNKLLEISKLQQFKLQQSGALRRRSIEEHNERVEACERDIERLKSIISEAVKPAKSSIFSNRSSRKDEYLKANLDKYRDVLVEIHEILTQDF